MGIRITDAEPEEALVYDRVFMDALNIDQTVVKTVTDPAKYAIRITYRMYAVDSQGAPHYRTRSNSVVISDYLSEAMQKAATGDMDLLAALGAIQDAVAIILQDKQNLNIEVF